MIKSITIENAYSFKDATTFSMEGLNKLKTFKERLYDNQHLKKDQKLLKVTPIFGPNAVGKTNLFRVIQFIKDYITKIKLGNNMPIPTFKLDKDCENKPSIIELELLLEGENDRIWDYKYRLVILKNIVVEENLSYKNRNKERLLYSRIIEEETNKILIKVRKDNGDKKEQTIILDNLTTQIMSNSFISMLIDVDKSDVSTHLVRFHSWIKNKLEIISSERDTSTLIKRVSTDSSFKEFADSIISKCDIGIKQISPQIIGVKELFSFDEKAEEKRVIDTIMTNPHKTLHKQGEDGREYSIYLNNDGEIEAGYWGTFHENDKTSEFFQKYEESDGTIKLLEILPSIYDALHNGKVVIIDEIENSLHTGLVIKLVEYYTNNCDKNKPGQLIFSTHNNFLFQLQYFRQDEILMMEKRDDHSTELFRLSEFPIRNDMNIMKNYFNNTFGSLPNIDFSNI